MAIDTKVSIIYAALAFALYLALEPTTPRKQGAYNFRPRNPKDPHLHLWQRSFYDDLLYIE